MKLLQEIGIILNIVYGLQDYLSFKIRFLQDERKAWLGQLKLLDAEEKNGLVSYGDAKS